MGAWEKACRDVEAIASSCTAAPQALRVLQHVAEQLAALPDLETADAPQAEGLSEFATSQLARFFEQTRQLRQDIEHPEMPTYSSDGEEDEADNCSEVEGKQNHMAVGGQSGCKVLDEEVQECSPEPRVGEPVIEAAPASAQLCWFCRYEGLCCLHALKL